MGESAGVVYWPIRLKLVTTATHMETWPFRYVGPWTPIHGVPRPLSRLMGFPQSLNITFLNKVEKKKIFGFPKESLGV